MYILVSKGLSRLLKLSKYVIINPTKSRLSTYAYLYYMLI